MEFKEWRQNMAEKSEEKVLKTMGKILEDSHDCRLYSQDLDDLKDCVHILAMLHPGMALNGK